MGELRGYEVCTDCGMMGIDVARVEQTVEHLPYHAILRHPDCGHVIMYRLSGEPLPQTPQPAGRKLR